MLSLSLLMTARLHLELTRAGGEEHNGSKSCGVSAAKFGFIFIFQTEKKLFILIIFVSFYSLSRNKKEKKKLQEKIMKQKLCCSR